MSLSRSHVLVEGRVQRVWFRESARQVAEELGVSGWVRNLGDGRVEFVFEGSEDKVAEAVAWARRGPEHAVVTGIDITEETPQGLTGFAIRDTDGDA